MTPDERRIVEHTLDREAGFREGKDDHGGPTNWGVTQATLARRRGRPVTVDEVKALTRDEAAEIYFDDYMRPLTFALSQNAALYELATDCAINHGLSGVTKMLQRALLIPVDGVMGPQTRAAILAVDPKYLRRRLLGQRIRLYGRLVSNDWRDEDHDGKPDNAEMAAGWLNRTADFVEQG